jgi:hypothetical protein
MDPLYTFTGRKRTWPVFFCVIDGCGTVLFNSVVGAWIFSAVMLPHYVKSIHENGYYNSRFIILIIMCIIYTVCVFFAAQVGAAIFFRLIDHWHAWRHSENYTIVLTRDGVVIRTRKQFVVPWSCISNIQFYTLPFAPMVRLVLKRNAFDVEGYHRPWYKITPSVEIVDIFDIGFAETVERCFREFLH